MKSRTAIVAGFAACLAMTSFAKGPVAQSSPLVFILNGPNMDLLGERQPERYGHDQM